MRASASARNSSARPAPSLPIIRAQGSVRPELETDSEMVTRSESGATAASRRTPRDFSATSSSAVIATTGTRKTDPAEARRAFWFHSLTVPAVVRTAVAPKASAERISVPRLPGSCKPAATRSSAALSFAGSADWIFQTGGTSNAAIPCGCCVATALAKTSSARSISSTPRGSHAGGAMRSERKIVFSGSPLSSASRSRFSPSMATSPPLRRACPAKAARSCLTRALAWLVTRIGCIDI